jgi:hypothetical protein
MAEIHQNFPVYAGLTVVSGTFSGQLCVNNVISGDFLDCPESLADSY